MQLLLCICNYVYSLYTFFWHYGPNSHVVRHYRHMKRRSGEETASSAQARSHGERLGEGGSNPHTSQRRPVGFAQIRRDISSFRRGGYPCIPEWPGEATQSSQNIEKPLGGRGSAPNPAGGVHSAPPDPLAGGEGADCPPPPKKHPRFRPFGPQPSALRRRGLFSNPPL